MYGMLSPNSVELGLEYGKEIRAVQSYLLPSVGNDAEAVRGIAGLLTGMRVPRAQLGITQSSSHEVTH